jgi:hypothetical protein
VTIRQELLDIEYEQWEILSSDDGAEFYRRYLTDDGLMAVPSPHGIMDRDRVISEVEAAPPIVEYKLDDPQVIVGNNDSGIVVYSMYQRRRGLDGFRAAISSAYVRRDGAWRMVYHQQTPLLEG